jgi:iron complex outermembrane receptor protein
MRSIITCMLVATSAIANAQNGPTQPLSAPVDTSAQVAAPPEQNLKEVTITATKKFIEQGVGKTIVNVSASPTAVGMNVLDVLRKSPGIQVDGNGNISMQGKQGVMILVDDKQVYLSGTELTEYLKSFASDNIATLELITQPSARYDASGNAGIINIRLKHNRKQGFNGNYAGDVGQGLHGNTHHSLTVYNQGEKLALTGQASYLYNTGYIRIKTDSEIKDDAGNAVTGIRRDFTIKESLFDDYGRLGADYTFSEKTKAGVEVSGVYHPNTEEDILKMQLTDKATGAESYTTAVAGKGFIRRHLMGNGYLKQNLGKDKDLMVMGDYLQQSRNARMLLVNTTVDEQGNPLPADLPLRMDRPFFIQAGSIKADYTQKLPQGIALEAGVKSSAVRMDNDAQFAVYDGADWQNDANRSNHFIYNEYIQAAYLSASKDLGEKWKAQCGLRAEASNIFGNLLTTGEQFSRAAVYLFPTAYLSYKPSEKHSFELNCGRRIDRPGYNLLNPFKEYYGQYNYKTGNPALLPQLATNVELKHSYGDLVTTTLSYGRTASYIYTVPLRGGANGVVNEQPMNVGANRIASMSVAAYKKLLEWCETSLNATGYYQDFETSGQARYSGYGVSMSVDTTATLKHGWRAQMSMGYSPRYTEYGTVGVYRPYYSAGVSKKLMKDSATLTLNISDPLRTARASENIDLPQVATKADYEYNTQYFVLGFNYKFGKQRDRADRQSGLSEEKGRM